MAKINQVENTVFNVLSENKNARGNNYVLIYEVLTRINPNIKGLSFDYVMTNHKKFKLPSVESITRVRRKVQAEHEHLKPTQAMQKIRKEEEQEYINYAHNLN